MGNGDASATFKFERLDVWHEAIAFADHVYAVTRAFPESERFGLSNQMRRAAASVSANIAEGCTRNSSADFTRFLEIAIGSLFEVVSHATIARRQGFLAEAAYREIYDAAERLGRMLSGLRRGIKK